MDRYVLEEGPSRGGMGVVWKAWDLEADHLVAVKLLDKLAPDDIGRFRREAALLAELQLPGVVRYLDHGTTTGGEPFLVMEWLEGQTLEHRLEREGLTIREATALAAALAGILAPLHARDVVHRDLKPENLLIPTGSLDGIRVIDFGLARHAREALRITQTGVTVGTPGYMAPEQVRGGPITPAADVFALGCILYECIAGMPAFAGENQIAVQAKILFAEPPRLRVLDPRVPADLEAAIARMLAKRPTQRPPHGAAAQAALVALRPIAPGPARRSRSDSPATAVSRIPAPAAPEPDRGHLGLIMALGSHAADSRAPTPDDAGRRETTFEGVARPYGGRPARFEDGSVVIAFPRAVAADVAERAARCALALHEQLPGAVLTVVTGALAIEELIDRAATAVGDGERATIVAASGSSLPIAVDPHTASLLQPRFRIHHDPCGWWLLPESRR